MNEPHSSITHETDLKRHHARVSLPACVTLDNKDYALGNLSAGGLSIAGVAEPLAGAHSIRLLFSFDDFRIQIDLDASIRHYDRDHKTLGVSFLDPGRDKTALLAHLVRGVLHGETIAAAGILKSAFPARVLYDDRYRDRKPRSRLRVTLYAFLIAAAAFSCMAFIARNLHDRLFVVHARNAFVSAGFHDIAAPEAGLYTGVSPPGTTMIRKGEAIGAVKTSSGQRIITSPCDCFIRIGQSLRDHPVAPGQIVARAVPVNTRPLIVADLALDDTPRLNTNAVAEIKITGTSIRATGRIRAVDYAPQISGLEPHSVIVIEPDAPLPADLAGRPAQVKFR